MDQYGTQQASGESQSIESRAEAEGEADAKAEAEALGMHADPMRAHLTIWHRVGKLAWFLNCDDQTGCGWEGERCSPLLGRLGLKIPTLFPQSRVKPYILFLKLLYHFLFLYASCVGSWGICANEGMAGG